MATTIEGMSDFDWKPYPEAAHIIRRIVASFGDESARIRALRDAMLSATGTRLVDWVDHIVLSKLPESETHFLEIGFEPAIVEGTNVFRHRGGMFPTLLLDDSAAPRMAIKVESIVDFLIAQGSSDAARIQGAPTSPLRMASVDGGSLWAVERHGYQGFTPSGVEPSPWEPSQWLAAERHFEAFQLRQRTRESDAAGFEYTEDLIQAANADLNVNLTCDLFFAAERRYWQGRNHAARVQKRRQDKLGLGWANHDHHTYRSSREQFANLIRVLERLGFTCRERFYGGRDAGWGAQVLEQPNCGIVIFADVDLAPDEVTGDFAHQGLESRDQLGTVGLWCKLHGEAFLQAGMHHLECQFDFSAARQQLDRAGISTMKPFTDFPFLKQAFTQGEVWPVAADRIDMAVSDGHITQEQAQQFRTAGSIGSHLEILERNDGYKGFNQTGISEIIRETDPRHQGAE